MRHNIKSILPIIAAVITLVMAVSCGHRPTRDALERADALIDEHADSALAVLQTIDTTRLSGRRDRALYGLLMTQALVKLHEPVTSDSLIAPAARYFAAGNDRHHAMRALYYHGVVKYDNEQYPTAMVQFFRARDIATDLGDHFWAGLACRGISDIYNQTNNVAEELVFSKDSYHHFLRSGRWLYTRYARLDLSRAYCRIEEYDTAIVLARESLDTAKALNDDYFTYLANSCAGITCIFRDDYKGAIPYLQAACNSDDTEPEDYEYLAHAYVGASMPHRGLAILDSLSRPDSEYGMYIRYLAYRNIGDKDDALSAIESFVNAKSISLLHARSNGVGRPVIDYFDEVNEMTANRLEVARMRSWLVFAVAVIILMVFAWIAAVKIKNQKMRLDNQLRKSAELQSFLDDSRQKNSEATELIRQMFATKYELLTRLCSQLARVPENKSAQNKIVKELMALVDSLAHDKSRYDELVSFANKAHGGLYDDFHRDLPNLKEADYRLFLFSCYRFSNPLNAVFLNVDNINSIYDRKRRLKDKIKQLDFEKRSRYMSFFE